MNKKTTIARIFSVALALALLPVGCEGGRPPQSDTPTVTLSSLRALPAGTRVSMLELSRKSRTRDELASHMLGVAETLAGFSLSISEAKEWADASLREGDQDIYIGIPFSQHPNIRASYVRYFDELVVTNTEMKRPGAQDMLSVAPNSALDLGIGEPAASAIADGVLARLEANHHIDAGPYAKGGTRASRRTISDIERDEVRSVVSDYTPYYYRTVDSVPLLNTLVAVTVTRDGKPKQIRVQEITSVTKAGMVTMISDEDAFALMETQAEASVPSYVVVEDTILDDRQTGYFLPAEASLGEVAPVSKAKVVFKTSEHVTRARVATISLDERAPVFQYLPTVAGTPRLRQDGEDCNTDSDCNSGHCFSLIGTGGICGECSSDADCSLGCTPPGVLSTPPRPAACSDGTEGSGCETDGACATGLVCADIVALALGYSLRSCSECATDADCAPAEVCGVSFDFSEQSAYRECASPSTRQLGEICSEGSDCASGVCSPFSFPEGTEIGVCGECNSSTECSEAMSCSPTEFRRDVGFVPSSCN